MNHPATILVLDDDPVFRRQARLALGAMGYRVLCAATGEEADAEVEDSDVDLVVLDGLLSDVRGLDWLRGQRDRGLCCGAVFASGFGGLVDEVDEASGDLGIVFAEKKPVRVPRFYRRIDMWLRGQGAGLEEDSTSVSCAVRPEPEAPTSRAQIQRELARRLPARTRAVVEALDHLVRDPEDDEALEQARFDVRWMLEGLSDGSFLELARLVEGMDRALTAAGGAVNIALRRADLRDATNLAHQARDEASRLAHRLSGRPGRPWPRPPARLLVATGDDLLCQRIADACPETSVLQARSATEALGLAGAHRLVGAFVDQRLEGDPVALVADLAHMDERHPLGVVSIAAGCGLAHLLPSSTAGARLCLSRPLQDVALRDAVELLMATCAQLRVLIVDPDPRSADVLAGSLSRCGLDVATSSNPLTLLEELDDRRPDVLLLDERLTGVRALELARLVRTLPAWCELPVVLRSEHEEDPRRLVRAGVDRVLGRQVEGEAVAELVKIVGQQARIRSSRLRRDPATGLPSRGAGLDAVESRLVEARRSERALSLALVDAGSLGKDQVTRLGRVMRAVLRGSDIAARFDDQTCLLCLPEQTRAETVAAVERVLATWDGACTVETPGRVGAARVGIATFPDDGLDLHALLSAARRELARDPERQVSA